MFSLVSEQIGGKANSRFSPIRNDLVWVLIEKNNIEFVVLGLGKLPKLAEGPTMGDKPNHEHELGGVRRVVRPSNGVRSPRDSIDRRCNVDFGNNSAEEQQGGKAKRVEASG